MKWVPFYDLTTWVPRPGAEVSAIDSPQVNVAVEN
jgi:hypothetical protein